jgi:peptide/nickel transport system substrate-binding protein
MNLVRSRKRRLVSLGLLTIGVALALAVASGGQVAAQPQAAESTTGSTAARTVKIALVPGSNVNWLNPLLPAAGCSGTNFRTYQSLIYRPLLWPAADASISWKDSLARKIDVSRRGTRYTIHLRNWKWSDGKQITATDVADYVYVLRDGAKLEACFYSLGGMPNLVKSIRIVNPQTLILDYKPRAQGYFPAWVELSGLASITPIPVHHWLKVCPKTRFAPRSPSAASSKQLWSCLKKNAAKFSWAGFNVVNGPFKIDKSGWQPGRSFTFTRNPSYSGHDATIGRVILLYQTSTASTFAAFKAGQIDVGLVPPNLIPQAKTLSSYSTFRAPPFAMTPVFLNLNPAAPGDSDELLGDRAVRIALAYGVDHKTIVNDIAHGGWVAQYGPVPAVSPYVAPNLKRPMYPFNIQKGRQTLEAAGYQLVKGVMQKGGKALKFTLTYLSGDETLASEAQFMKENWAKEGIDVTLNAEPNDVVVGKVLDPKNYEMYMGVGWGYFPTYYPTGEPMFQCKSPLRQWVGAYCNPNLDKLVDASTTYGTSKQGRARFNAYQTFIAREAVAIFIPGGNGLLAVRKGFRNVAPNFSDFAYGIEYWRASG